MLSIAEPGKSSLKLFAVAWPFVAIILLQTLLAAFSLQMTSSLRAYVTGESLWSKGQHDALYYLNRYVASGSADFLENYRTAIAIPLGDRDARLALEAAPPDIAAATAGFLKGGNHPEDVPGIIWLFQNFRWFSYMKASVDDWRTAETAILELAALAGTIDEPAELARANNEQIRQRLDRINRAITPLTRQFSDSLGEGIRFVQRALLGANIAVALAFALLTVARLNSFLIHRRRIEDRLRWGASHDHLTQLANRRLFEARLDAALRAGGTAHALIILDLDQFKTVNDSGGHAAGDELLQRVSAELSKAIRNTDLVARLGGDEFGLLLSNCSAATADKAAQRLREAVAAIGFVWDGLNYSVSASIGLVHLEKGNLSLREALRAADIACYIAKEKGRNRVHVYAPQDEAQSQFADKLGWVQRLHRALEEDNFRLFAQPIVATAPDASAGEHFELLLRLKEGETLVPPAAFIPAAERFGLMPAIDRWVVRNALEAIRLRKPRRNSSYAINLSGLTLTDDSFLMFLRAELARTRVPPQVICFEVTETCAIANFDQAVAFIEAMRGMGCRFALDDFGVGMSSLSYLKRLPADLVKIDGSFVRDMLEDETDRVIVEMINRISHLGGKKTVAEFVENLDVLHALRQIGVDYAQGYAIGRPVPFDTLEAAPQAEVVEFHPQQAVAGR